MRSVERRFCLKFSPWVNPTVSLPQYLLKMHLTVFWWCLSQAKYRSQIRLNVPVRRISHVITDETFSPGWPSEWKSFRCPHFLFPGCLRDDAQYWADSLSQRMSNVTAGLWHQECSCQCVWELSVFVSHAEQKDDSRLYVEHWSAPAGPRPAG